MTAWRRFFLSDSTVIKSLFQSSFHREKCFQIARIISETRSPNFLQREVDWFSVSCPADLPDFDSCIRIAIMAKKIDYSNIFYKFCVYLCCVICNMSIPMLFYFNLFIRIKAFVVFLFFKITIICNYENITSDIEWRRKFLVELNITLITLRSFIIHFQTWKKNSRPTGLINIYHDLWKDSHQSKMF